AEPRAERQAGAAAGQSHRRARRAARGARRRARQRAARHRTEGTPMSHTTALRFQSGFGNEFATEAVAGALPQGRNSPQRSPRGLYAELISGTAFTAPRALNRRTWMYRRQPSVVSGAYAPYEQPLWTSGAAGGVDMPPDPLRWHPFAIPDAPLDFVDGVRTVVANGDVQAQVGVAALVYTANRSMQQRVLVNADAEMMFVPQQGRLRIATELGRLEVGAGEVACIPRGLACRIELPDGPSRGYV